MKRGRPKKTTMGGLKYLDEGQLRAFFQTIRKTMNPAKRLRDDLAFSLTLFFGMRVAELSQLRMADVDRTAHQIRIAAVKHGLTKTEDVPGEIRKKLDTRLKKKDKGEWLFPGRVEGKPASVDRWKACFKTYAAAAGLPKDFSVHSLRHSCAIALVLQGASPIRIKSSLQHRRASSSERYFEQARFSDAGRKMAAVFRDIL